MPKKLLFLSVILFVSLGFRSQGQVIITEIMYNDPSSGNFGDSLEYVEITNNGGMLINLAGYQFTAGITFTFPSAFLFPGAFVVIARNDTACNNFFSLTGTLQWDAGQSLTNQNGEAIVLKSPTGVTQDSVRYYPSSPWPTAAAGLGSSLQRCNPNAPSNDYTSWAATGFANSVMYGMVAGITVYATPGQGCTALPPYTPTYDTLPFYEHFDSIWLIANDQRDVPSNHWKNDPATGNASWRRADDGAAAAWSNPANGAYTPAGANSTSFSARFHSAGTLSGYQGILQVYLNFSPPGLKQLSFWYNNTAGTDSLTIWLSENGGLSFYKIQNFTNTSGWEQKQVVLGTTTSNLAVVKFTATSNNTANDIGLDEVAVVIASDYDAGISAIPAPANMVFTGSQDAVVTVTNYGNLPLTSLDIGWTVNGVAGTPLPWTGNIPSGGNLPGINLGPFTLTPLSLATIKAWTSNPNGNPDGNTNNDTLSKSVYYQTFTPVPYTQHFDSTWLDKFATHEAPDNFWNGVPSTGNPSWRRDDDGTSAGWTALTTGAYTPAGALNTIHSARFHTSGNPALTVGIMDLYLDFSTLPGNKELRFHHINSAGNDSVAVWMSVDAGQNFTFLSKYTTATAWTLRTVNLGSSISNNVILRFKGTSNASGNTDPGIDEVVVNLPQPDFTLLNIIQPTSGCSLSTTEIVRIQVKNTGNMAVDSIPVSYNADGTLVQGMILDTMHPGDTVTYTFSVPANLSTPGLHQVSAMVHFPGDYNPTNDSLAKMITNVIPITTFPFAEGFENGGTNYFILAHGTNAHINVEPGIGNVGSYGIRMDGNVAGTWPSGSGNSTTATLAWNTYTDHQAFATSCLVNGTLLLNPIMKLDLRQTYINGGGPKYSWFRVLVNDTVEIPNTSNVLNFNPTTSNSDVFITQTFDLSAYAGSQFKITFQSSCKFNDANAGGGVGDNVFIDNVVIKEKPAIEVALLSWQTPVSGCGLTNQENITIQLKNQGSNSVHHIGVGYSLDNGTTWTTDTLVGPVAPDSIVVYTFLVPANFSTPGAYPCIAFVSATGDPDNSNDSIHKEVYTIPFVNLTGYYLETFETATGGWSTDAIAGANEWELGTPQKTNLNSAHSGTNAWVTSLTQNYTNNINSYLLSPCFDFTNMVDPYLSVWLNLHTENNYDGMIMEILVNDSAWYKPAATAGFYNNNSTQPPLAPPKWSGNNNGWTRYTTAITELAGKAKVQVRFRFQSDYTQVDEGVAIDNVEIYEPYPDPAVTELITPVSTCGMGNAETVTVVVENAGMLPIANIPISYILDGNPPIVDTIPDTLAPAAVDTFTFFVPANFSVAGTHTLSVQCTYTGDYNASNDVVTEVIVNTADIVVPPYFVESFDGTGYFNYLTPTAGLNSSWAYTSDQGYNNSGAIILSGGAAGTWPGGSDTSTTAAQAWSYTAHIATLHTCTVSLLTPEIIYLYFGLRQSYSVGPKYSWFRVMVNDTIQIPDIDGNLNFNPITQDSDVFIQRLFFLTPYGPDLTISLQASCKYSEALSSTGIPDASYIDEMMIGPTGGITEYQNTSIGLYPNPANDILNLSLPGNFERATIEVMNIQGQVLLREETAGKQLLQLNIGKLLPGIYAIRVWNNDEVQTLRFVKSR